MFSETPFLTRYRGMWVWGLIRSGMKAVGDFRSQFFVIFYEILEENMQKLTVFEKYNRPQLSFRCESTHRPIYPRNGLGKEFLKTYSIIKNFGRGKNKKQKTDFSGRRSCRIFSKKSAAELRKINFSQSSDNFRAIRDTRWRAEDMLFPASIWSWG